MTFRQAREKRVARALGLFPDALPPRLARALRGLAPVLDLVPGLSRLPADERAALRDLVVLKAGRSEAAFTRALARAGRLAAAMDRAGRRAAARR